MIVLDEHIESKFKDPLPNSHLLCRESPENLPFLQSLTAARRKLNPVFDLGFNPVDIKNRLTGVTVYTVANNETGEFVLASGRVRFRTFAYKYPSWREFVQQL